MPFFKRNKEAHQEVGLRYAEGLPEICYSILPGPKALIRITRGSGQFTLIGRRDVHEDSVVLARKLNQQLGVTEAQRRAMEAGLIYGWDSPKADPSSYGS